MFRPLKSILVILTRAERRAAARATLLVLTLGLFETLGVASVMPFLAVAADPDIVARNAWLARSYELLGFTSHGAFVLALAVASGLVITLGSGLRLATNYTIARFVSLQRHALSVRLFEGYLSRPYVWFLDRNSADLAKGVLTEAHELASGLIKPLMDTLTYGVVALLLVGFLVALDPMVALGVTLAGAGAYGLAYLAIREVTGRMGTARLEANRHRYTAVLEAFEAIKTLKMRGLEARYLERYARPSHEFAHVQARHTLVQLLPRYAIETVAIAVAIALAAVLVSTGRPLGAVLPLLGAWALASYRLLPAFQRIFASAVQIRFGMAVLESCARELERQGAEDVAADHAFPGSVWEPIRLRQSIHLRGAGFRYARAGHRALAPLDLRLDAHTTVGIVGPTGAGKTTLVDLVAGLLDPSEGEVLADGVPLVELGLRRWRRSVGYVPQIIHLVDATLAENIALGIPAEALDPGALERASRLAQLHPFVEARLPDGYQTRVGDRGVRLSGGERQRVGIARALYFDPDLLILDEGTSALDGVTESAVLEAIRGLRHRKTILLVAHRLSTVRECDRILVLESGRLVADGDWGSLLGSSAAFRELAAAAGAA